MRTNRTRARVGALTLALSLAATALAAPAVAQAPSSEAATSHGRAPEAQRAATELVEVDDELASTATIAVDTPGKPRNDIIGNVPVNPDDASLLYDLIPYHDFPSVLRGLQESDRVSVEVFGQSVEGRDLHLVVITDMDDDEWVEWQRLSDLRTEDPIAAIEAFEDGEYDDWRVPVFINNNIHGNEWEGTDAFVAFAQTLAFSEEERIHEALEGFLFIGTMSNNPDGRVNATRANAAGYDMNRDWTAQTQPEVRAVRDQMLRYNPVSLLDTHGYVASTLIEPTTGPHGQNYELDLYLKHGFRAAEAMEDAILALEIDTPNVVHPSGRIRIPYRDNVSGWDGWPAIYTPMWAMQHGIVGHTVEVPLNPRGQSESVRHSRALINTAVGEASMEGNLDYLLAERDEVIGDQLEFYRRGVAGESTRPVTDEYLLEQAACGSFENEFDDGTVVEHCNSDVYVQDFPRAWVIPFGEGQRSDTAALATAQYLLDNDVQVSRAAEAVTLDGVEYEAGTFVVDMHQAKRNAAQNILEVGRNLSDDWANMYGDAAFSVGASYGASLVEIENGDLPALEVIDEVIPAGDVPAEAEQFGFVADSMYGVAAVNALQAEGIELSRLHDGTFVVPGDARTEVEIVAALLGVDFVSLSELRVRDAEPFETLTIGFRGGSFARDVLLRMGFEVVPVTHQMFNVGEVSFSDLDALFIGASGFTASSLSLPAAAEFEAWLAAGNPVVVQGQNGAQFSNNADLLPLAVANAGGGDGMVAVVNNPASKVTGDALDVTFVDSPRWISNVDDLEGVTVDQRIADGPLDHFLAGHWRRYREGAGQALVVSGEARGTQVTYFGSDPTYRAHTQGLFTQVAEALWPALPEFEPLAPTADAGGPYEVELGEELTLDATASISPDDLELTYTWDLSAIGGGEAVDGDIVDVTPTTTGTFEVDLTVTDPNEPPLSGTDTATVVVTEPDETEPPVEPEPGAACEDVTPGGFPDVVGGPHGDNIGCVTGYGIALGQADGSYNPAGSVRRDQMASFLHRMLRVAGTDLPANAPDRFADDDGSVHEDAINDLAALGIVQGRPDGTFAPRDTVTRDQMASFIVRTLEAVLDRDLTAPRSPFTDTPGSPHSANIDVAYDLGIALGRTATTFEPRADVRRDQMASFLARSLDVLVAADVELTPLS